MVWNQNGLTTVTWTIKTSRSKSENWEIADYKLVIIEDRFLIKKKKWMPHTAVFYEFKVRIVMIQVVIQ